jgi:hypothetical protein
VPGLPSTREQRLFEFEVRPEAERIYPRIMRIEKKWGQYQNSLSICFTWVHACSWPVSEGSLLVIDQVNQKPERTQALRIASVSSTYCQMVGEVGSGSPPLRVVRISARCDVGVPRQYDDARSPGADQLDIADSTRAQWDQNEYYPRRKSTLGTCV